MQARIVRAPARAATPLRPCGDPRLRGAAAPHGRGYSSVLRRASGSAETRTAPGVTTQAVNGQRPVWGTAPKPAGCTNGCFGAETPLPNGCEAHDLHYHPKAHRPRAKRPSIRKKAGADRSPARLVEHAVAGGDVTGAAPA